MQAGAGEPPATSETARKEANTELDRQSATPLLSEELTALEKAPKGPKKQTISTSIPDFQSFLPLKQQRKALKKLKAQDTQFWMVSQSHKPKPQYLQYNHYINQDL